MKNPSSISKLTRLTLFFIALFGIYLHAKAGDAGFFIKESLRNNSAPNLTFGGTPSAYLTSGIKDPLDNGWLRLTSDFKDGKGIGQKGYAIVNQPFSSSNGVLLDFEFVIWRESDDVYGGGDGLSVFLFDATASPFHIGSFGGSLGYAQRKLDSQPETPGLSGAYIGIGVDEFGNFSSSREGKYGGEGVIVPNAIGIRGSQASNYAFLTGTGNIPDFKLQYGYNGANKTNRPTDTQNYRRLQVEILPKDGKYSITVRIMTVKNGTFKTILGPYTYNEAPPAMLKLGLAASTGASVNCHEVRNLFITTAGGLRIHKTVDKTTANVGDNLTYTVDVFNQTENIISKGLIMKDIVNQLPSSFKVNSVTFDGHGDPLNSATIDHTQSNLTDTTMASLKLNAYSYGTFTITGKINSYPANGIIKNTATLDISGTSVVDPDIINNTSEVTTTINKPSAPDFEVTQSIVSECLNSSSNPITIKVSNKLGTLDGTVGSTVTVTDTIPVGLKVIGSPSGSGWSVNNTTTSTGRLVYTFSRNDALAKGTEYPPITLELAPDPTATNFNWKNRVYVQNSNDGDNNNNSSSLNLVSAPQNITITVVGAGPSNVVYKPGPISLLGTDPGALTGLWTDDAGKAVFKDATKYNTTVTLPENTESTLRWTISSGSCTGSGSVAINYYPAAITLVKSVDPITKFKLGDEINYKFDVKNTSNTIPLNSIVLTDSKLTINSTLTGDLNNNSKLDNGETWIYSGKYKVKQSDVDSGYVKNSALVTAKYPNNGVLSDISGTLATNDLPTITPIEHLDSISLLKSVINDKTFIQGDSIEYEFRVINAGTTTLHGVNLTDNKLLPLLPKYISGDLNSDNKLNVGEVWIYRGKYKVTLADANFGKVSNLAKVTALNIFNDTIQNNSGNNTPTVAYLGPGRIQLKKEITNITPGGFKLNDNINYKFSIKNIGTPPLQDPKITDEKIQNITLVSKSVPNNTNLGPNEIWEYTGSYKVTQSDVEAGKVTNQALVTAITMFDPTNFVARDSSGTLFENDFPTVTPIVRNPKVVLEKRVTNATTPSSFRENDGILYEFRVSNKGDVALYSPVLRDDNFRYDPDPVLQSGDINNNGVLDINEVWIYTGRYTVTNADLLARKVINSATIRTKDALNAAVVDTSGTWGAIVPNNTPIVTPVAIGPLAIDDNDIENNSGNGYIVLKETPRSIPVTNNDRKGAFDLDLNQIIIITQPTQGTAIANVKDTPPGNVTYTAGSGAKGTDYFTYRIKDKNGDWSNTATVTVVIGEDFIIPNLFTPNGDDKNDTFKFANAQKYTNIKISIYNRWGNVVYTNPNYQQDWDGHGLNEGTYYYVISYMAGDKEITRKGWVLLKR